MPEWNLDFWKCGLQLLQKMILTYLQNHLNFSTISFLSSSQWPYFCPLSLSNLFPIPGSITYLEYFLQSIAYMPFLVFVFQVFSYMVNQVDNKLMFCIFLLHCLFSLVFQTSLESNINLIIDCTSQGSLKKRKLFHLILPWYYNFTMPLNVLQIYYFIEDAMLYFTNVSQYH